MQSELVLQYMHTTGSIANVYEIAPQGCSAINDIHLADFYPQFLQYMF